MQEKRQIGCELKVEHDLLNITIGTIDKKNPNTIYFEINGYLIPEEKETSYCEILSNVEKEIRTMLKDKLKESNGLFSNNFICVFDIADKRVKHNKKSYFSLSFFITIPKNSKNFKDLSVEMTDIFTNTFAQLISIFGSYGFIVKKSKEETISFDYL